MACAVSAPRRRPMVRLTERLFWFILLESTPARRRRSEHSQPPLPRRARLSSTARSGQRVSRTQRPPGWRRTKVRATPRNDQGTDAFANHDPLELGTCRVDPPDAPADFRRGRGQHRPHLLLDERLSQLPRARPVGRPRHLPDLRLHPPHELGEADGRQPCSDPATSHPGPRSAFRSTTLTERPATAGAR